MYAEVNAVHEEMLAESKDLAKALYSERQALRELLRVGQITRERYEEEREKLEAKAWRALEELKERYDMIFSDLERRIKACFRA